MDRSGNEPDEIREIVREHYGKVASQGASVGCAPGCCGAPSLGSAKPARPSESLGYSPDELAAVPTGADLGLGCGNPQAIAGLAPGEVVLDLGSGAGFDCLLAARQVGPTGRVIGVDMTAGMIERARANVRELGVDHVEFRLGEIEQLPVADATVDVIISNCVINLTPDKRRVFAEAFRVLKPGGRLAIADVVNLAPLPETLQQDVDALTGCVAGAANVADIERTLAELGFVDVAVTVRPESRAFIREWMPGSGIEDFVASATVEAKKPSGACCAPTCCGGAA
jgi:SAM-dependent methyltransferase